ncbi:MAG: peptide deformylase [Gemmatimonadota bacterium]|nr:peptide deformylase [Candidatus Palauibacterales bacterium]
MDVRLLGDPVLRRRGDEITNIDESIRKLAADMLETMYAAEGIGLAAPQVGISLRLFVMEALEPEQEARAVINPVITHKAGTDRDEEGCLSVPGLNALVDRAEEIVMEGLDLEGEPIRIEAAGLLARCIQHEVDHLDGILFIDRVSPLQRKMLLGKWKKLQAEAAPP